MKTPLSRLLAINRDLPDITEPEEVEVMIDYSGDRLWVNVNGVCICRCCRIGHITFNDLRASAKSEQTNFADGSPVPSDPHDKGIPGAMPMPASSAIEDEEETKRRSEYPDLSNEPES